MDTLSCAISLGSCGHLRLIGALTWVNGRGLVSFPSVPCPVIPRCSPPDLVPLWCGRATAYRATAEQILVAPGRGLHSPVS
jgi:hypothetical protein